MKSQEIRGVVVIVIILCTTYTVNQHTYKQELRLKACGIAKSWLSEINKETKNRAAKTCLGD